MAGGLPRARVLVDRRVERDDIVALLDHGVPPEIRDVALEQHAVVPVVVRVGDSAVDLGGGEDQAAALAERDDLVERSCGHRTPSLGLAVWARGLARAEHDGGGTHILDSRQCRFTSTAAITDITST